MKTRAGAPTEAGTILAGAARGSAFLVAGRLTARAGAFVFFALLARWFPASVVGSFASAQAVGLILYGLLDYGLTNLLVRDLAAPGGDDTSPLRAALRARGATAAVSLALAMAAATIVATRMSDLILVWLAMMFDVSSALLLAGARRERRLGRIAASEMIRSWSAPAILCCVWLVAGSSASWAGFARLPFVCFATASALSFAFVATWQRAFVRGEWLKPAHPERTYAKEGLIVAAATVAVGIHSRIDLILLRILDEPEAVAAYAGAYALLNGAYILPTLYSYTLFPDLARLPAEGAALREVVERGARMLATLGSLASAVLACAPEALLGLAFGSSYARGGIALAVLAAAVPFVFVSNLSWNTLVSRKRELRILIYISAAALLNVLLNVLWIPYYSLVGAAAATLVAEILVWAWSSRTLAAAGLPSPGARLALATLAAAAVPVALSLALRVRAPGQFRATAVLVGWYLAVRVTGLVRPGDLRSALGLMRRSRAG